MKIITGSDHGGYNLKRIINEHMAAKGHQVMNAGTDTGDSCDYSHYALIVARSVAAGEYDRGILVCGTGLGMSMAANRIGGIRAALCLNEYMARMARAHNNANILCLGERTTGDQLALSIVDAWLEAEFEGGRHERRINLFDRVC